jgi:hypothetical protein
MMDPRRIATIAILCGTLLLTGWRIADFFPAGVQNSSAARIEDPRAPSLPVTVERAEQLPAMPAGETVVAGADVATNLKASGPTATAVPTTPDEPAAPSLAAAERAEQSPAMPTSDTSADVATSAEASVAAATGTPTISDAPAATAPPAAIEHAEDAVGVPAGGILVASADAMAAMGSLTVTAVDTAAASDQPAPVVEAAPRDAPQAPAPETPVQLASLNPSDPLPSSAREALTSIDLGDDCLVVDPCIDRYLWAIYQRTPKEDTTKVTEQRKVAVKRKGKMVTVTRGFVRLVDNDFTWKDPKAAERVGMPMMDYVIGGMDRSFKVKLFHMLRAAEQAGLSPGITSAFRDDYRQSIASGLKAATNRSYHGGSTRGGYGHGLAADVVSVKGGTRNERWASSENFWKWIDAHGSEFGVGRPYLRRDPPHVGPTNGNEYASKRGGKIQLAASVTKTPTRLAARDDSGAAKRSKVAKSSLAKSANVKSSKIAASSKIAKTSKIASLRR